MTIHIGVFIGYILSLTMAYKMWGLMGFWFTFGLLLTNELPGITYTK